MALQPHSVEPQHKQRLLLLRHAQIEAAHSGRLLGATDVALDPAGAAQAAARADRVLRLAPQLCYCSPLRRCRQTAAAVAPGMTPRFDADLREIDFGQWEDRSFAAAAADDPALVARWAAFADDFAFPGGECVGDFLHRVHAAADRLQQTDARTTLVVTHGGVIRAMICYLLGLPPRHYVAFAVDYLGMAVIDLCDGKGVLTALERPDAVEVARG